MKVLIDAFDCEEDAVAFIDWFCKQADAIKVRLLTTTGMKSVDFDGVDTHSSTSDTFVINIVTYQEEED